MVGGELIRDLALAGLRRLAVQAVTGDRKLDVRRPPLRVTLTQSGPSADLIMRHIAFLEKQSEPKK